MGYPVETEALGRVFGARVALDDVSLAVREGEIFGLLGPNGGGKTTLFRILATLLPPSTGRARVAGHDVVVAPSAVRSEVGVVFQSPSLDPELTVAENLRCAGNLYGMHGAALEARCRETTEALGISDRMGERARMLSGGLQRRAEIAKCLLPRPRVLLLDEPSTGLDPAARAGMWEALESLRRGAGMTAVLTTHLMDEAGRCGRVALLHRGRIVACDTPDALRSQIATDVLTLASRDPEGLAERVTARFGWGASVQDDAVRVEIPRAHEQVARLAEAFPGEIDSVTAGRPTLEDVFLRLTGERWTADPPGEADVP